MNDALPPRYDIEDLARRGDEIYDRDILPKLRPEDEGKIVAIDIGSGDHEVAPDELNAAHGLRARHPNAQILFRRVGSRYVHRFGHRRKPPMKVVGKRKVGRTTLEDADRLLRTAWALRGTDEIVPRGVYRFRTFEEADEWMTRMMARTYARLRSKTSSASAAPSTKTPHGTS